MPHWQDSQSPFIKTYYIQIYNVQLLFEIITESPSFTSFYKKDHIQIHSDLLLFVL